MPREYDKIFNYEYKRAKKLSNDSYLEDLTGLIAKTASLVDSAKHYYFNEEYYLDNHAYEPNNSFVDFINSFKNTIDFSSSNKIYIIRGIAGVGKTLFFQKGVQILTRNNHVTKYIPLTVDFKNIDQKQKIKFYEDFIYNQLKQNAIDCIRQLDDSDKKNFKREYDDFCFGFLDTPDAKLYPMKYFCNSIYTKYAKPCIIVFDNIDLSCVQTQKNVFKATSNVFERINRFMLSQNMSDHYRVYFAMRPETILHSAEVPIGQVINFPLPNIKMISLSIIKDTMLKIADEYDKTESMTCEVTFYSIISNEKVVVKTFSDVANYFIKIFDRFFNNIWNGDEIIERLGNNEDFHCNLVNYNVRAFLSFLADTLYNGGFKPLTKDFNNSPGENHYSVFDYIEMLIRGGWIAHPGNKYIDGEGGNKAPIVFNVFDTCLWDGPQENKIKHFMLYIRILQYYYFFKDEEVSYYDLKIHLKHYFQESHIKLGVQSLTFVRILYSYREGDENIASKKNLREVEIDDHTMLRLSPMGKFYMEKFICEFEYIYQMAVSSLMLNEYVKELSSCWNTEKERVVLCFLRSIFYIIKDNFESYDSKAIEDFKLIFCRENDICCKPFRRMLYSFLNVMNHKITRAKKKETRSIEKLSDIYNEAKQLSERAENYFFEKFGD